MTPLSRANSLRACFALSYIVAFFIDRVDTPGAIHSDNTEKLVNWPYGSEGDLTIEGWHGRRMFLPAKTTFRFSCKQFAKVCRKFRKRSFTQSIARVGDWRFYAGWFNRWIGSKTVIRTFLGIFGCSVWCSFAKFLCMYTKLNRGYTATKFCKQWVTCSSIVSDPVNFEKFSAQLNSDESRLIELSVP